MIFDRGGFSLAKNLPNGLKVSLELFHVGVFNRVDRVEVIGVGKGASHLNLNSGTCKTCGTGKTDDCLNLAGGADEDPGNDKFCELLEFFVLRVPPVLLVPRCAKHSSFLSLITHLSLLISHL